MREFLERLISILYPRHCPICHEVVKKPGTMICPQCRKYVIPIKEPLCKKCGKPLDASEREYCRDCTARKHSYTRGLSLLPYTGKVKKSIHQIKFHNKREYLDFYGPYLAQVLGKEIRAWEAEVLIPVPLHKAKHRKRGFNQAELLAEQIGKELKIPVRTDLVFRIRHTKPQKELLFRQRQNNLKGAFKIIGDDVKLKKVVLIDDIYTTGSTVDEIAKELLRHGAGEVYFVTLCIGRDDG